MAATLEGFVFNEGAFTAFVNDPGGPIAGILSDIAEAAVVNAQETVGTDWFGSHQATNPPPGPPYRRTGDMQASIRATPPFQGRDGVIEVDAVVDAVHRGFPYPVWLLIQGYRFLDVEALSA